MNTKIKIASLILVCVFMFSIGLFFNRLSERTVSGSQEQIGLDTQFVPNEIDNHENEVLVPDNEPKSSDLDHGDTNQVTAAGVYDRVMDERRGTLLTEEIKEKLTPIHSLSINGVTVQVSDVILVDTRAFVNVCIQSEKSAERMDFGYTEIFAGDVFLQDSYINYEEKQLPGLGSCMIFDFFGAQDVKVESVRFEMAYAAYAIPDEGSGCQVYDKRAKLDSSLEEKGIAFKCVEQDGMIDFQITRNDSGLQENIVYGEIQKAVNGITEGPWVFELKAIRLLE